jgi:DNA-binding XRE family transcriptional regulator
MLAKQNLARRLREARQRQRMTLKDVERLSGFSSTHISEIERGRTSPTVKALLRIAQALAKDPCYFVESRELEEVSLVADDAEARHIVRLGGFECRCLTEGILGGRLQAYLLRAEKGAQGTLDILEGADGCLYALTGTTRIQLNDQPCTVARGDSLHACFARAPELSVEAGPVELICIVNPGGGGTSIRRGA